MQMKKTIAALAVTGSLTTAGVAVSGTAWASTPTTKTTAASPSACGDSCWHIYSTYANYTVCYANGVALVEEGLFGGAFIAFKCVGNSEGFWTLWGETQF